MWERLKISRNLFTSQTDSDRRKLPIPSMTHFPPNCNAVSILPMKKLLPTIHCHWATLTTRKWWKFSLTIDKCWWQCSPGHPCKGIPEHTTGGIFDVRVFHPNTLVTVSLPSSQRSRSTRHLRRGNTPNMSMKWSVVSSLLLLLQPRRHGTWSDSYKCLAEMTTQKQLATREYNHSVYSFVTFSCGSWQNHLKFLKLASYPWLSIFYVTFLAHSYTVLAWLNLRFLFILCTQSAWNCNGLSVHPERSYIQGSTVTL